jgi:hypothetical protein
MYRRANEQRAVGAAKNKVERFCSRKRPTGMEKNTEANLAAAIDKLTVNVEELRKTIEFLTKAIKDQMMAKALAGG